jgi:hypothetical protein
MKNRILSSVCFFRKSCCLWDNVEKDCGARQATDDNMAHAHCMLDMWGYKHALTICNTYCFSTATTIALTRPQLLVSKEFSGMCMTSCSPKISGHFPLSVFLNCSHLLCTCNILDLQIFDIITLERVVELNSRDSVLCCDAVEPGTYLWIFQSNLPPYIFILKSNAAGFSKTSANFSLPDYTPSRPRRLSSSCLQMMQEHLELGKTVEG